MIKALEPIIIAENVGDYRGAQVWFKRHKLQPSQPKVGGWALVYQYGGRILLLKVRWTKCNGGKKCKIEGDICRGTVGIGICCFYGCSGAREDWLIYPVKSKEEGLIYLL